MGIWCPYKGSLLIKTLFMAQIKVKIRTDTGDLRLKCHFLKRKTPRKQILISYFHLLITNDSRFSHSDSDFSLN